MSPARAVTSSSVRPRGCNSPALLHVAPHGGMADDGECHALHVALIPGYGVSYTQTEFFAKRRKGGDDRTEEKHGKHVDKAAGAGEKYSSRVEQE